MQFTSQDFDEVLSGSFVTKVIYLPDLAFQKVALAGVETLINTRLAPGVDPIIEAARHGAIVAIVRLGNKDLQLPSSQMPEGGASTSYQLGGRPRGAPLPMDAASMGSVPGPDPLVEQLRNDVWQLRREVNQLKGATRLQKPRSELSPAPKPPSRSSERHK